MTVVTGVIKGLQAHCLTFKSWLVSTDNPCNVISAMSYIQFQSSEVGTVKLFQILVARIKNKKGFVT